MLGFSAKLEGLEEIKSSLSSSKFRKDLEVGVGKVATELHSALSTEVYRRYNVKQGSSGKVLDSVLVGKSTSTRQFGKNVIEAGLTYKHKGIYISRFPNDIHTPGRIGGFFYATHTISIIRGQVLDVHGKFMYGGFIPRHGFGKGSATGVKVKRPYYAKKGYLMFERVEDERYPIVPIFGPSLSKMASYVYETKPGRVKEVMDKAQDYLAFEILRGF